MSAIGQMGGPAAEEVTESRQFSRQLLAEYRAGETYQQLADAYGYHLTTIWSRCNWARNEEHGPKYDRTWVQAQTGARWLAEMQAGRTSYEIAAENNISQSTVWRRTQKARKAMR